MLERKSASTKVKKMLRSIVEKLKEKEDYLNRLDAEIGDGDHGRTIINAFKKAEETLLRDENLEEGKTDSLDKDIVDIGILLRKVGRTLAFSTGAAAGPLFGTAFIEAGKVMEGKREMGLEDWATSIEAAEAGIIKRGKGKIGEKTMLDTLHPVVETLKETLNENKPLKEALLGAKKAARKGMESTREMVSKRGRSSRLGERTRGHIDPGAASSYYIIEAIIETCLEA